MGFTKCNIFTEKLQIQEQYMCTKYRVPCYLDFNNMTTYKWYAEVLHRFLATLFFQQSSISGTAQKKGLVRLTQLYIFQEMCTPYLIG